MSALRMRHVFCSIQAFNSETKAVECSNSPEKKSLWISETGRPSVIFNQKFLGHETRCLYPSDRVSEKSAVWQAYNSAIKLLSWFCEHVLLSSTVTSNKSALHASNGRENLLKLSTTGVTQQWKNYFWRVVGVAQW